MSDTLNIATFSEAAGLVSGAYLSGLSAAYQKLHDQWLSEITPAETKLQQVVEATRTAYEDASSWARTFRDGAIAQGNTGMAAVMDKWSVHYQAKADAIGSPMRTAAQKVSDLHAAWSSSLNTFASQVPGAGTLVVRSLGPAVDLFGVGKGVIDLIETGETKSLANACWGIALAEAFGLVAGAFAVAVFSPGVLGVAIVVGVGATAGSAVGGVWGDDISKWFSTQIVSGIEAIEGLLFPSRVSRFKAATVQQTRRLFGEARYSSPLILDLDGNGVVSTRGVGEGAYFDHDGNGLAEQSGWVGAGDALLVRDLNGNGRIDGGAELFGNQTELSPGVDAAHGFAALGALDSNGDGKVNALDSAWSSLRLWKDANGRRRAHRPG